MHTRRGDVAAAITFKAGIRRSLRELLRTGNRGRITLRDGQVRWESLRTDCDRELLVLATNVICDLAEVIESRGRAERAAAPQQEGQGGASSAAAGVGTGLQPSSSSSTQLTV